MLIFMGFHASYYVSYFIAGITPLILIPVLAYNPYKDPAYFLLIAKLGISLSQCCNFLATMKVFPPQIVASVFAICNLVARSATIFAPILA